MGSELEHHWDEEWEKAITDAAVDRVRKRVNAKHYQMFDLYVFKGWPVSRIARALKVSRAAIFLAKHRISKLIKKEVDHLRSKPI
jgi:RNA polymerase sigma-70 factor (ECF subfamily)